MPTKNFALPPLVTFHGIAAARGDGLHPELVRVFNRLAAEADGKLAAFTVPPAEDEPDPNKSGPSRQRRSCASWLE